MRGRALRAKRLAITLLAGAAALAWIVPSVGWSIVTATVTTDSGTLTADAGDLGATVSVASKTITISGAIADVEKVLNIAALALVAGARVPVQASVT